MLLLIEKYIYITLCIRIYKVSDSDQHKAFNSFQKKKIKMTICWKLIMYLHVAYTVLLILGLLIRDILKYRARYISKFLLLLPFFIMRCFNFVNLFGIICSGEEILMMTLRTFDLRMVLRYVSSNFRMKYLFIYFMIYEFVLKKTM